jgi:hypothetical protein
MKKMKNHCHHADSAVYGMGFLGALIYYISTATGFWMGVWGVLKAIVWPAFLVFHLLKFLGM